MTTSHKFNGATDASRFILAGNARVTLQSEATGTRFTYRVRKSDDGNVHFVSLLVGPDNSSDFQYLGIIRNGRFSRTAKSRIGKDAPSSKAFAYSWYYLNNGDSAPRVAVWHEGRCGRCGRALTVPNSIESGLGPVCADK